MNVVGGDEASNVCDAVTATLTNLLLSYAAACDDSPRADTASTQLDISGRSLHVTTAFSQWLTAAAAAGLAATGMHCHKAVVLTRALLPAECANVVLSLATVTTLNPPSTAALLEYVGCWPHVELGVVVVLSGCGITEPNLKPPLTFQEEPVLNGGFTVCIADKAKTLSEPALKVNSGFS